MCRPCTMAHLFCHSVMSHLPLPAPCGHATGCTCAVGRSCTVLCCSCAVGCHPHRVSHLPLSEPCVALCIARAVSHTMCCTYAMCCVVPCNVSCHAAQCVALPIAHTVCVSHLLLPMLCVGLQPPMPSIVPCVTLCHC